MNDPHVTLRSSHHPLCAAVGVATVSILLCASLASNATGQDVMLIPDKPYYRMGETVRVEYRLPSVKEYASDMYICLAASGRSIRDRRVTVFDTYGLDRLGRGVIKIPDLTDREGLFRLSVEHPLLKKPPFLWIWVFSALDPGRMPFR